MRNEIEMSWSIGGRDESCLRSDISPATFIMDSYHSHQFMNGATEVD